MKRNRTLALLLAFILVFSLTACGTNASVMENLAEKAAEVLDAVPEDVPEAPEVPEVPEDVPEAPEVPDEEPQAPAGEAADGEIVVLDNEDCTFILKGYDPDGYWGYTWDVFLENKTDMNLMFSMDEVSVNGVMCDPYWASTVSAGMRSNVEISWDAEDFERCGITDVTVVEFTLRVYDDDNWLEDDLVYDVFTVYPMGENAVQLAERAPRDSDIVLVDNESCTIIAVGFDDPDDDYYAYTMELYLVNKTDDSLTFSIDDAAVNGYMCDPFWIDIVTPGKAAYSSVTWYTDDFAANHITEVESLTLPFTVYKTDDWSWSSSNLVEETFTVTP